MGFARVLKDGNGDPSGYRECDGEVAYMPKQQSYENIFHLVQNIDIDTMEIVNHDFIKDCKHVYRRGKLLQGISPEDFHKYNSIYVGNHQLMEMGESPIRSLLRFWTPEVFRKAKSFQPVMAEIVSLCIILRDQLTLHTLCA